MGGVYTVTLIPGDGIGQEITDSVKEVFESLNVPVEWEQFNVSGETHGSESLFKEAMESLRRNRVGLKGECYPTLSTSLYTLFLTINVLPLLFQPRYSLYSN